MTCSTPDCKNEPTHKNKIAGNQTCLECMESSIDARFYDVADFEAINPEAHAQEREAAAEKQKLRMLTYCNVHNMHHTARNKNW